MSSIGYLQDDNFDYFCVNLFIKTFQRELNICARSEFDVFWRSHPAGLHASDERTHKSSHCEHEFASSGS